MEFPLWTLIPAIMLLTLFYLVIPNLDYNITEWIIGNGIVSLGIGLIYLGELIFKK